VRLLLDTHIALWAITGSAKLSRGAVALLTDRNNQAVVSAVSIWEIAIKHPLRRSNANDFVMSAETAAADFADAGYDLLSITPAEAAEVERLPPMHGDPFDRLLLAQARLGPFRLLTHDRRLAVASELAIAV
jgi:PIN domain nuclease of toxin-antitoxin system